MKKMILGAGVAALLTMSAFPVMADEASDMDDMATTDAAMAPATTDASADTTTDTASTDDASATAE